MPKILIQTYEKRQLLLTEKDLRYLSVYEDRLFLEGKLKEAAGIPLVLHGGSGIEKESIQAGIKNGIAKINIVMGERGLIKPLTDLPRMAEKSVDMLHRALTAFTTEDVALAKAIPDEDDEIDALYTQIYRVLITYVIQAPTAIERSNWLIWAAHNLERVGDRVTNICERTIFIATGEMEEIDSSDDEISID